MFNIPSTEINTEQAFSMLPYFVDVFDKLQFQKFAKDTAEKLKKDKKLVENKSKFDSELQAEAIKYILKNSNNIKTEVFEIAAICDGTDVETVKKQSFIKTFQTVLGILNNSELNDFFQTSYAVGYGETIRLLHSKYSIDFVKTVSIKHVKRLLNDALEIETKTRSWEFYLAVYPHLKRKQPFDEFYKQNSRPTVRKSKKSAAEIIKDAEAIKQKDLSGR